MGYTYTPAQIEEMKAYVREHPPQPEWDEEAECFDAQLPYEEDCSRLKKSILQDLGEWDYENDCPKP